ncbi:hypothetical protein Calow_0348 [Caldicellulosiruptor owensensis OL]|uniref:Uncharacterized protein n=1 Tax=Caldicellulosiruptor owensensis (strain ATCC 700167 / DSM 13100 / OL) TaxID=632518 RepID=E4Q3H7_CALOW|nr:hypothetical protein Calow_0348 [Caldicellulosiruptor owensensis OL]
MMKSPLKLIIYFNISKKKNAIVRFNKVILLDLLVLSNKSGKNNM